MSIPRPRPGYPLLASTGRRAGRVAAATLALVALVPVLVALPVSPATAAPSSDELPVTVDVTAVTPQVVRPGQDVQVTVTVRNDGDTELANPRAVLRLDRKRPATSAALDAWASAEPDAAAGVSVRTRELGAPLAPGASADVTIDLPASAVGLLDTSDAWGPRGLAVELTDGRRRVGIERTFLLWLPDDEIARTRLSVLVPVVATLPGSDAQATSADVVEPLPDPTAPAPSPTETETAGPTPSPSESEAPETTDPDLEVLTAPGGRLADVLEATQGVPGVSWALDPSLVARAADGGPVTSAWLERLTSAAQRRDVLTLPWADPDLAALAHAGRGDLLDVATTAAAGASALDSGTSRTVLWAADAVPDAPTAALAAGSDVPVLVVGSEALAPERSTALTPSAVTTVETTDGDLTALVPDAALSSLLTDPDTLQPGATPATLAQRLLAETAVLAHEGADDDRELLATVPRGWAPDPAVAGAGLEALASAPWLRLTPAGTLLDAAADGTAREDLPADARSVGELSAATVNALADARDAAVAFAGALEDPQRHLEGLDHVILTPLAVSLRADDEVRRTVVDAALADATARRSGISVLVSDRYTMVSSTNRIRISLRSELDQAATVQVEMRPRKGCLDVSSSPTATIAPGSEQVVVVEVSASANCDVLVDVFVLAPDGTSVASAARFDAHVSPTIESVGTAVVGAILALGLVLGIIRTVRRGQTARRGARLAAQAVPGNESETAL
jgi:hypothetical protein